MNLARQSNRQCSMSQLLLRGLFATVPARWRGVVLLTAFLVLFPLWITTIIWEAVIGDTSNSSQEIEEATVSP